MQLIAKKREEFGKRTKKLRRQNKLPGVIYGKGLESLPVTIDSVEFGKVFEEAGETNLVDLKVGDEPHKVLIKEIQYHPVSDAPIHVDFHEVNLKEKINAGIPVEINGEDENELVKSGEALVLVLLSEISIEALPTDLPNEFVVDVSGLSEIGDGIALSSLEFDKEKIELVGYEEDELIVKLDYAVQEEEEEEELSEEELLDQLEATGETDADEEGEEGEEKASEESPEE